VPQLGTGTQKTNVKVTVVGDFGSYSPMALFTYDPAINPSTASSPGGLQNPTSMSTVQPSPTATIQTAANANSNPQSTNAPTMIGTETKVVRNITDTLTVKMSPNTPPAVISTAVIMEVSIFNNVVQNNVTTKKLVRSATSVRTNLVSNNQFFVTYSDVGNLLINFPIPPFNTNPINARDTVLLQFTLNAYPVDRVKYPQPITQSFNFTFQEN
jgi:hypothetical protein